jgi:ATP-dependent Clp protease ATP-binding subunit ClpB
MCRASSAIWKGDGSPAQGAGHGGDVSVGRDLGNLLNLTDKEAQKRGDQFIASEMFLLALATTRARPAASPSSTAWRARRWKRPSMAVRGGQGVDSRRPKASARR